ncbi:MAG: recombinase RecT, partial [Actinomycetota bacterium]
LRDERSVSGAPTREGEAMTVRQAVAKTEQGRDAKPSPAVVARDAIERQAEVLDAVLPAHVDRRRFSQLVLQAIKEAPELLGCFSTQQGGSSFLLTVGQAAIVGLEPNSPTQECWILPRRSGKVQEAQLILGYRGIAKLARRSGTLIGTPVAEVVREHDSFDYGYGPDGPYLTWKPASGDRGALTHAFAIAWYRTGGRAQVVLDRVQVEARRAHSDSWRSDKGRPHSPWTRWPEAMWCKSALRALAPFLDLAPEAEAAVAREERPLRFDPETGVIEAGEETIGELPEAPGEAEGSQGGDGTSTGDGHNAGKGGEGVPPSPDDPPASRTPPTIRRGRTTQDAKADKAGQDAIDYPPGEEPF